MGTVNIVVGTVDVVDVISHQGLGLFQGETAAGDTANTDISAADGGIDGEGTIVRADCTGIIHAISNEASRPVRVHIGAVGVAGGIVFVHDIG